MMGSKKTGRGADGGVLARGGGAVLGAAGAVLKAVTLPAAALAIYTAAVWCLWQYAAQGAVRPGDPATVAAECTWLSAADVAELNAAVSLGPRASLYDRWICSSVAGGYGDNAWVERVVSVRRAFPDRLVVDLSVRRPAAYVRSGGRLYLVDRGAYRLPVRSPRSSDSPCPVIEGVRAPVPAVGARWDGRPVLDALLLAEVLGEVLRGRGPGMTLSHISVTEDKGTIDNLPQLAARTASGMIIDWGGCSESGSYLFPSLAEKRQELEKALGGIADPAGIESIMLRYRGCSLKPRDEFSGAPRPDATGAESVGHLAGN